MNVTKKGDGEVIVFLHGIVGNQAVFQREMNAFSDRFTTISYDYLGHSDVERGQPISCTINDLVAQLKTVLDSQGITRVHLCTLSYACYIAYAFSERYPEYVSSICAVGGFVNHASPLQDAFHRLWDSRHEPYELWIEQYSKSVNPDYSPYVSEYTTDSRSIFHRLGLEIHPNVMRDILFEKCFYDVKSVVKGLSCPHIYIMGEYDALHTETLVDIDAPIYTLRGAPHVAHLFNQKDFDDIYLQFLTQLSSKNNSTNSKLIRQ